MEDGKKKEKYMRKVFFLIYKGLVWLYVHMFGWFFYDLKYLKGRWFCRWDSMGWQWAARDIFHRFLSIKHVWVPWPISPDITCPGSNIEFDVDDINNFQGIGNYFQTFDAKIVIGKGTYIAVNVGIITSNHDFRNLDEHYPGKDVVIGRECWIGMNSVILPGVILGDHTIVGAGSVVTKSFPEGNCVIAGNPAKIIRKINFSDISSLES